MSDILLLGSEKDRAAGISKLLQQDGHRVDLWRSVESWRQREREAAPDLVVAAVGSAAAVLAAAGRPARGFPAPLLFVQHEIDAWQEVHLEDRLVDRIESPFMADDFLGRVDALTRVRRIVLREDSAAVERASTSPWRGFGARIAAVLGTRVPKLDKPETPYREVAVRVAAWTDRRDGFEPGHAERVTSFSALIAHALGLSDTETESLLRAAMLHDIGKVALPVEVLRQRGPLEERQLRLLRTHAERGATLLRALDKDEEVAAAVQFHHERIDGGGYHGRNDAAIPRAAKILAVAEAFDAMTMTRVAPPMTTDRAQDVLKDRRGAHFDAQSVDALCDVLRPRANTIQLASI